MAINFLDGVSINGELTTTGATNNITTTNGSSSLYLLNLTRTTTSLTTAGDVGIGTTSPISYTNYSTLTIDGSSGAVLRLDKAADDNQFEIAVSGSFTYLKNINSKDLWFGTNNTERMRITSGGNVGIGTTSPSHPLSVISSYPQIKIQQTGQTPYFTFGSGTGFAVFDGVGTSGSLLDIRDDGTSRMRISAAGNVGLGTTSPTQKLDITGSAVFSQRMIANSNQYYVKYGVWSSAGTYGIGMTNGFTYGALNNDYAMTFCMNQDNDRGWWWGYDGQSKSTGAMSCNTQGKLKINHSIGLGTVDPSSTQGRIDASNDIVAYSTSDIRLKDNIKTIDSALNKVNKIQGIEFDWIEKEEVHGNSGHDVGVIAQEIEKILPDVVTTRDNGYKAVKYEKIVPLLIEAIKDLSKQVDGLKRLI